jgi:endoglycosylceramidase
MADTSALDKLVLVNKNKVIVLNKSRQNALVLKGNRLLNLLALTSCIIFCVFIWLYALSNKNFGENKISVKDSYMVDSEGRVRIFHGFHSVAKHEPWYLEDILNVSRFNYYRSWGFNVIRLGVMWSGAQPKEGPNGFNDTYLILLERAVRMMGTYGINVILDMHQDVASSAFHTYDGFPRWVLDKMPAPRHPYPWPLPHPPSSDNWATGYLAEAVGQVFQNLYSNVSGTLDDWGRFWQRIAMQFGKYDHVLGFDIINEPWAGDIYHDPSLLLSANAGKFNLAPAYAHINAFIRNVDSKSMIFYEPVTWGVFGGADGHFGTGFDSVPGGNEYRNRSVLSYHYYCWLLNPDDEGKPFGWKARLFCDDILGPAVFRVAEQSIALTGGSSFLTEFGLCEPNDDPSSMGSIECKTVLHLADNFLQSWTYWDSQFFDPRDGSVRWSLVRPFARVYARAVAGIPVKMEFDETTTKLFFFQYLLDITIDAPTEIFVPEVHYPTGFEVQASSGLRWAFDDSTRILTAWPSNHLVKQIKTKFTLVYISVELQRDEDAGVLI